MPIPIIPVIGVGVLGAGGIYLAMKAKGAAAIAAGKQAIADECEAHRVALEQAAVAGTDPRAIQQIRVNLAACVRKAGTAGVPIDVAAISLLPCQQQRDYIQRVFVDYRATSYSDPVARDNKRNAMLTAGAEMVLCLKQNLDLATTREHLQIVLDEINQAAYESRTRAVCFFEGSGGCGRFAVNEEEGNVRGIKELEAIGVPLGAQWYGTGPGTGYEALGFGWGFRNASGLNRPEDLLTPLYEGQYGGLRLAAEKKLAAMPVEIKLAGGFVPPSPSMLGILRGVRIAQGS